MKIKCEIYLNGSLLNPLDKDDNQLIYNVLEGLNLREGETFTIRPFNYYKDEKNCAFIGDEQIFHNIELIILKISREIITTVNGLYKVKIRYYLSKT